MADPRLERLIGSLNASFGGTLARAEDEAADDLAFSLSQNRALVDVVGRWGSVHVRLDESVVAPVAVIGFDYLGAGAPLDLLVPAGAVVAIQGGSTPPEVRPRERLAHVLYRWARAGEAIDVGTTGAVFHGSLASVGEDHLELRNDGRGMVIANGRVSWVRRVARSA